MFACISWVQGIQNVCSIYGNMISRAKFIPFSVPGISMCLVVTNCIDIASDSLLNVWLVFRVWYVQKSVLTYWLATKCFMCFKCLERDKLWVEENIFFTKVFFWEAISFVSLSKTCGHLFRKFVQKDVFVICLCFGPSLVNSWFKTNHFVIFLKILHNCLKSAVFDFAKFSHTQS